MSSVDNSLQSADREFRCVESARADVQVAEANRQQLLSNVLPRINATGNAIRNSTSVSFGSGSDRRTILAQDDWSYRVVLSQPVFAGRREFRAYSQANIGIENARLAAFGTEDAVLLRVASNYLALVNSEARMAIDRRNIDLATNGARRPTPSFRRAR